MNFLTPAFVRVNNPEKRKELLKWMFDIGYAGRYRIDNTYSIIVAGLEGDCADVAPDTTIEGLTAYELIDCGENIELFKALAAMNNENDREQWFVRDDYTPVKVFKKCAERYSDEDFIIGVWMNYHKATVEEIVEYFKNNEK
jgi:hypothetical protein